MLRTDNEATSIRWEVIREEDEKKNNADTNISSSNLDGKHVVPFCLKTYLFRKFSEIHLESLIFFIMPSRYIGDTLHIS